VLTLKMITRGIVTDFPHNGQMSRFPAQTCSRQGVCDAESLADPSRDGMRRNRLLAGVGTFSGGRPGRGHEESDVQQSGVWLWP